MNGYDTDPVFSPDGKSIAWLSMERAGFEADRTRLFVIDLASREKKELTVGFDHGAMSPVWKADGSGLYFNALAFALQAIYSVDLEGNITRITPEDSWYDFGGVKEMGNGHLLATAQSMSRPDEIVSVSIADGSFTYLSHENDDIYAQLEQETYELRWIPTTDGLKMLTWVVYPAGFDSTKVYPTMLFCTGGPQQCLSQSWSTRWNFKLMAANGYIVILPAVRCPSARNGAMTCRRTMPASASTTTCQLCTR